MAEISATIHQECNTIGRGADGNLGPPCGVARGRADAAVVPSISDFVCDPFAVNVTVLPPAKPHVGSSIVAGATEQDKVTVPANELMLVMVSVELPDPPGAAIDTAVALELFVDEIENVVLEVTVSWTPDDTGDDE